MSAKLGAALGKTGIHFSLDEPLARHTTLGVGGPTPALLVPRDAAELGRALDALAEQGIGFRAIGAGSNLLVDDDGVDFAVIATHALSREPLFDGPIVTADAGVFLPRLVRQCAERGLSGLEWAIGVPGSVGGALRMNAGAWRSDMSRVVDGVRVVTAAGGPACERAFVPRFAYRQAGVSDDQVVTGVRFRLDRGEPAAIQARVEGFLSERKRSQPTSARSAGCAFKNPPGDSAGRLIDATGLKGLARGAAVVSPLHANFVLNRGGASAAEVCALIAEVRERVHERWGIRLENEIVHWQRVRREQGANRS